VVSGDNAVSKSTSASRHHISVEVAARCEHCRREGCRRAEAVGTGIVHTFFRDAYACNLPLNVPAGERVNLGVQGGQHLLLQPRSRLLRFIIVV